MSVKTFLFPDIGSSRTYRYMLQRRTRISRFARPKQARLATHRSSPTPVSPSTVDANASTVDAQVPARLQQNPARNGLRPGSRRWDESSSRRRPGGLSRTRARADAPAGRRGQEKRGVHDGSHGRWLRHHGRTVTTRLSPEDSGYLHRHVSPVPGDHRVLAGGGGVLRIWGEIRCFVFLQKSSCSSKFVFFFSMSSRCFFLRRCWQVGVCWCFFARTRSSADVDAGDHVPNRVHWRSGHLDSLIWKSGAWCCAISMRCGPMRCACGIDGHRW